MRSLDQIRELLDELEHATADTLEAQDLDFKEWKRGSVKEALDLVIEMAICMANGGGGSVIFGVNDRATGRDRAIVGVPADLNVSRLKKAVYDSTDPKLTPEFEDLVVPEGTGRLLIMKIHPGLPPYTDTSGRGKIRVGTDCQPLTGTLRRQLVLEAGEADFLSTELPGDPQSHVSPAAIEALRDAARSERAPEELLTMSDLDLLRNLDVLRDRRLTMAGLILAGTSGSIEKFLPGYVWTHLRMLSDTEYSDRMDGRDPAPIALSRIMDRIMADNPITTIPQGLFHFEYRTYPEVAIREALMNAFCHRDYRIASPTMVKQFNQKLEFSNPGGFIGGVSSENILHHRPVTRNPLLVAAFTTLRLVNRSNLGVPRMFKALLIEGKEPPIIDEQAGGVTFTFLGRRISIRFRKFVEEENKKGNLLTVDNLLILRYLLGHLEIDTATGARICQRTESEAREVLIEMEIRLDYLERGGTGRGTYWTLKPTIHRKLSEPGKTEISMRIDWEAAKTRVLSVLKQRCERGESGLSNADIRGIARMDRNQVKRLMDELRSEAGVSVEGKGKASVWVFNQNVKR